MALSIVKRLERCERIGRREQGEGPLNGENCQVMTYKIKIKDCYTTNQIKIRGSLNYVALSNEEFKLENLRSPCKLQHINLHEQSGSNAPSLPLPPYKPQQLTLREHDDSQQNLHVHDEARMQLQSPQNYEDNESSWLQLQLPWKLQETDVQEHVYTKTGSQAMLGRQLKMLPSLDKKARSPWKLIKSSINEQEGEMINHAPRALTKLQQTFKEREDGSSTTEEETEQLSGNGEAWPSWNLEEEGQEKVGGRVWEDMKKMQCECCGMEEDCTLGYEERVRGRLRGHLLCGLCEEAVGEERKRVGGGVQAALEAHMQPCQRFSHRARSKVSPPPSDVEVPHAVCRLLRRHLSTPSARSPSSSSSSRGLSLPRSWSMPNA